MFHTNGIDEIGFPQLYEEAPIDLFVVVASIEQAKNTHCSERFATMKVHFRTNDVSTDKILRLVMNFDRNDGVLVNIVLRFAAFRGLYQLCTNMVVAAIGNVYV